MKIEMQASRNDIPILSQGIKVNPTSVEDFSKRIRASAQSVTHPSSQTTFKTFVGMLLHVAKDGLQEAKTGLEIFKRSSGGA